MSVILIKLELQMVLLLSIMYGVEYVTLWTHTFGGIALTSDVRFITKLTLPFTVQLTSKTNASVECNAAEGLFRRANSKRTCFRCGRFCHIAMECTSELRRRHRFTRRRMRFRRIFRRRR